MLEIKSVIGTTVSVTPASQQCTRELLSPGLVLRSLHIACEAKAVFANQTNRDVAEHEKSCFVVAEVFESVQRGNQLSLKELKWRRSRCRFWLHRFVFCCMP